MEDLCNRTSHCELVGLIGDPEYLDVHSG
jgi:hypothetical protein